MSKYTEAHFAAALLACGPHVVDCPECVNSDSACPNARIYQERVSHYYYNHIQIFPTPGDDEQMDYNALEFWKAYVEWVEK